MPLKLNVGISKKIGQPDYGSLGATCHVEVELDGALLRDDLETFHHHIRNVFTICRQAVNDELARYQGSAEMGTTQPANQPEARPQPASRSNGNNVNGNSSNGNLASQKQRNYADQLAGQIPKLGARRMESLSQKMFNKPLADLSSLDASALIDPQSPKVWFTFGTLRPEQTMYNQ